MGEPKQVPPSGEPGPRLKKAPFASAALTVAAGLGPVAMGVHDKGDLWYKIIAGP